MLAFLMIYIVFVNVDVDKVFWLIKNTNLNLLLFAFLFYICLNLIRSIRIYFSVNRQIEIKKIIPILLTYNFINFTVPFRLGEFSYVFLIRRSQMVSTSLAFTSLAFIRILDVLFLFVVFFLFSLFGGDDSAIWGKYKLLSGLIVSVIVITVSIFWKFLERIKRYVLKLKQSSHNWRLIDKILNGTHVLLETLNVYRKSFFLLAIFSTACIWFIIFGFFYILASSVGTSLSFFHFSVCVLLINLTGLLPIQGIAGFGTFEGAVVLGQIGFGIPFEEALAFSVSLHILYLMYFGSFGIAGMFFLIWGGIVKQKTK